MKVMSVERRDIHVELDFSFEELMCLKLLLEHVPEITYDPDDQNNVEFMKKVDEFYDRILPLLKQLENDFSQG